MSTRTSITLGDLALIVMAWIIVVINIGLAQGADSVSVERAICKVCTVNDGGVGTGTLIAANGRMGYVLTAAHVVRGGTRIVCDWGEGEYGDAMVVQQDAENDLCMLLTQTPKETEPLNIVEYQPTGAYAAIGYGGGTLQYVSGMTHRAFSQHQSGGDRNIAELHRSVVGGFSGCALLTSRGEVAGVVFAKDGESTYSLATVGPTLTRFTSTILAQCYGGSCAPQYSQPQWQSSPQPQRVSPQPWTPNSGPQFSVPGVAVQPFPGGGTNEQPRPGGCESGSCCVPGGAAGCCECAERLAALTATVDRLDAQCAACDSAATDAALADLRAALLAVQMTPGPPGPQGEKGDAGDAASPVTVADLIAQLPPLTVVQRDPRTGVSSEPVQKHLGETLILNFSAGDPTNTTR